MKCLVAFLLTLFIWQSAWAEQNHLDTHIFAELPVQHNGRIKPMDSFARFYLRTFSGDAVVDGMTADDWLADLIFTPERAYGRAVFDVNNPNLRLALDLPERARHHYSFLEIAAAMEAHQEMVNSILSAQEKNVTDPAQQQLISLYANMTAFLDISRSLSLVLPVFRVEDAALARQIGVPAGQNFSYLEMMRRRAQYLSLAQSVLKYAGNHPDARQVVLLQIGAQLEHMEADKQSQILRIVPPAWQPDGNSWLSPWAMLNTGQGAPQSAALLQAWTRMAQAYQENNATEWKYAGENIFQQTLSLAGGQIRPYALSAEYMYNHAYLFAVSLAFYLAAFLLLLGARRYRAFYYVSFALLVCGFLSHFVGEALRIYIMARPPVGTLYESIIFVGLIVVAGSLLLEMRSRRGLGLAIGALSGFALQAIGMGFAGGDTMEPLVAVLNTNFWLATHVIAITTGYGCCLLTGILGHIYLLQKILQPLHHERLQITSRLMLGAALAALFFALTGTMLGGIWADQSWGRFWGWDPKENGALLIVLWLLWMLHGRLSGMLRANGFAMAAAAAVIVVALSWFGVNLLNVGLHSYGFTSGIAINLFAFIALEMIFITTCGVILYRRSRHP